MNLLRCLKDPKNVPLKNTIAFEVKLASLLFGVNDPCELIYVDNQHFQETAISR